MVLKFGGVNELEFNKQGLILTCTFRLVFGGKCFAVKRVGGLHLCMDESKSLVFDK